jgi:hypothetical protein
MEHFYYTTTIWRFLFGSYRILDIVKLDHDFLYRLTNHGFMGRGGNKETWLEVKGEKQGVVVGLRRSRPIILAAG